MDESKVLIEILCRQNWQDNWIEEIDIEKFIELAIKNKVLSTLAHFIYGKRIGALFKGSKSYPRLKESLLLNERDKIAYKKVLTLIVNKFSEKNIDTCLLKGLSIPGKGPRDMGDLDILIHPEDLENSIEILENLGFTYEGYKRNRYMKKNEFRSWKKLLKWSNQFEFLDSGTGLLVELHTNLFERFRVYQFNLDPLLDKITDFWDRSIWSEELQCKIFSPEDLLWLMAVHNSIKRTTVKEYFALRNMLDIRNILESADIQWIQLFERAKEADTLVFLMYTLEMEQYFCHTIILEAAVKTGFKLLGPKKKEMIKIMHLSLYNLDTSFYWGRFLFRLTVPFVQKSRFRNKLKSLFIFPVLFLPQWRLRQIYSLPKGSPLVIFFYFLEPVRWFRISQRKTRAGRLSYYFRTRNAE